MAHILVVFSTKNGQTEKIANFIGVELRSQGHLVDVVDCRFSMDKKLSDYEGVIVGGPVYAQTYPRPLRKWVRLHRGELNQKTSAFFSVCLGVLQKDPRVQAAERNIVEKFFAKSQWRPQQWDLFAGALMYSRYNWFIKKVMKRISQQAGGATDPSQDYEYTDWQNVRQFSRTFSGRFQSELRP